MTSSYRFDFSNHPATASRPIYPYRPIGNVPTTVSVLTAFYNTDDVFFETTHSILRQSLQEWEWIIVDDGSTDLAAQARLEEVRVLDPRIHVFHQENRGPAAARNKAFAHSTGRYICLLDSDDLIEPTFLEKCVWFLESQSAFAFCNSWSVTFGEQEFLYRTGFEHGKEHLKANSGPFHSVIRREAYEATGGFDENIHFGHEDWDFWLIMAKAGYWGHTIPEYLEWYRRRKSGRQAQVAGTAGTDAAFHAYIKAKYSGLEKCFPNPQLKEPIAFESISTDLPMANALVKDTTDRRILFLIPWMVIGGADRVNIDWIRELIQRGYQVSVCATLQTQHEWLSEFTALTSDVFVLPNFLHLADFPRFLVYLIHSRSIDTVLISNCTLGYQLLPFLRNNCPDVAFVDLSHVEEPHWLNGGHPRFGVGYQDMLDLNIVTTRNLREWMRSRGADPERIEVCYSGVSSEVVGKMGSARETIRKKLGVAENLPLLIFGGRLCAQKRPEKLAAVLQELTCQQVPFHCVIAGDGELRSKLERLFRKYGLKKSVTMLGAIPHDRWIELLSAADILFLPSEYEGISVALFEAMAMGVVPVMSKVGGQSELVTSDCGVLVPLGEGDVIGYAAALRRLIEDYSARHAMAQASRQRIAHSFTLEHVIANLIGILDRAHELARSAPRKTVTSGLAKELAIQAVEYARLMAQPSTHSFLAHLLTKARRRKLGRQMVNSWVAQKVAREILSWLRTARKK